MYVFMMFMISPFFTSVLCSCFIVGMIFNLVIEECFLYIAYYDVKTLNFEITKTKFI